MHVDVHIIRVYIYIYMFMIIYIYVIMYMQRLVVLEEKRNGIFSVEEEGSIGTA